jgi:hypothetical protein
LYSLRDAVFIAAGFFGRQIIKGNFSIIDWIRAVLFFSLLMNIVANPKRHSPATAVVKKAI